MLIDLLNVNLANFLNLNNDIPDFIYLNKYDFPVLKVEITELMKSMNTYPSDDTTFRFRGIKILTSDKLKENEIGFIVGKKFHLIQLNDNK